MNQCTSVEVAGPQGARGTIDTSRWPLDGSRAEIEIILQDGRPVRVPLALLQRLGEHHYRLAVMPTAGHTDQQTPQPSRPPAAAVNPNAPHDDDGTTIAQHRAHS